MNVQIEALKRIPCFRDIVVYRPGYAIEYDFSTPHSCITPLRRRLSAACSSQDRLTAPPDMRRRRVKA